MTIRILLLTFSGGLPPSRTAEDICDFALAILANSCILTYVGGGALCDKCWGNGEGLFAMGNSAPGGNTRTPCIPAMVLAGMFGGGFEGLSKEEHR